MANTSLELTSLDFPTQKASLIASLRNQAIFKDYDFESSDLNILIDLLTVNTFKNAFYLNMALSEGFIDSAQLRNSVLSHAKELNYLPRSVRSAKANIRVEFTADGSHAPYIIDKGQSFTAQVKNKSFIFTIPETLIVASANNSFSFDTAIYEGPYVKESFVFDTNSQTHFKLSNPNIDTDSIVINVFEDSNLLGVIFSRAISLLGLTGKSKVYFIQTSAVDGNYEIIFGDNIAGYQPKNGSLIVVDYRVASGSIANGSGKFTINFDPTTPFVELTGNIKITTLNPAIGGDEVESLETTRFYAPRWFQTQERAIVPSDYEVLLKTEFPEIANLNVYGGEQLLPPQFGKVVVSLNIANVQGLPQSKQKQYYDFLKSRCPLSIFPIFVPPQYTYIKVASVVRYNVNVTNETINRIKTIVVDAITNFNTEFLNDFNITFRLSKLIAAIDDSDPAIVSNLTYITIYKKTNPQPNMSQNIVLMFGVPLLNNLSPLAPTHPRGFEKVLYSSNFNFKGQNSILEDDGMGMVRIVQTTNNLHNAVLNVGTIDYNTGVVQLNNLTIDSYEGADLCIYVRPRDNDVACVLNTIMAIESSKIDVSVEQLRN